MLILSPFAARKKPWSSHFWRLLISIVSLIASISAIWLDGPSSFGTFIALFSRSSSSKLRVLLFLCRGSLRVRGSVLFGCGWFPLP
ncbi:unnamed protein product [Mycena citricolor]|uniref:Uncharacterized protein n=1 Tax=Mycena citricolor TaxID=2018698 RepID=A0AAD2GTR6_9AGAR|nr:unnamed protein product [Mycena citricolor]CAK5279674.1 unnamed protein product [Mycena citricolor]